MAAILANPRYTGYQVWNRQRGDRDGHELPDELRGIHLVHRWNPTNNWVISTVPAHPALVSEDDVVAAQHITSIRSPDEPAHRYLFVGLLRCRLCGRCFHSHWVHGRPGYRCRHGRTSAHSPTHKRPATLYVREDQLLAEVIHRLHDLIGPHPFTRDDPEQVADYLRANHITISRGPNGSALIPSEPAIALSAPP